jgi:hypothetical protein
MRGCCLSRNRWILFTLALASVGILAEERKAVRARDLGVPFEGRPGQPNAITDVVGVMPWWSPKP